MNLPWIDVARRHALEMSVLETNLGFLGEPAGPGGAALGVGRRAPPERFMALFAAVARAADGSRPVTDGLMVLDGYPARSVDLEAVGYEADVVRETAALDDHTVRLNLRQPDIALIANLSDYPAIIMHPSYDGSDDPMLALAIGTGPFELVSFETGVRAEVRRRSTPWWGGEVHLDGVVWTDYGTDTAAMIAAVEAGEVDANYQTAPDFLPVMEAAGFVSEGVATAQTLVLRLNQNNPPYDDVRVRRALELAVDNAKVLEIGYGGAGLVAANHHVGPMHEDYADIGPAVADPAQAAALMAEAGQSDHEFDLVSQEEEWQSNSCAIVAEQMRAAGLNVKRTILPGATFWNDWDKYPFSASEWSGRPLGVQVYMLAYKTGGPWSETAFSNAEFDRLLDEATSIADAASRSEVMARLQTILRDEGVILQPYWRSVYRSFAPKVKGFGAHQSFRQFMDRVWIEA